MDIIVKVPTGRKCAASIDWNNSYTKAILSFGDLETPGTDVEIEFTVKQLAELGCVVVNAEIAGNNNRSEIAAKKSPTIYHGGSC